MEEKAIATGSAISAKPQIINNDRATRRRRLKKLKHLGNKSKRIRLRG